MDMRWFVRTLKRCFLNLTITMGTLSIATALSFYFHNTNQSALNIGLFYIFSLVLIALLTSDYFCGILASVISMLCINYLFTYPYYKLNFSLEGYPLAFFFILNISLIISTIMTHLKESLRIISEREPLLIEAEKEKTRANLLRATSHDLRTPLTSIIGTSSTYLENREFLSESEKDDLVRHILEDSNWLLNMVENLLAVTRIHDNATKVTKSLEPIEEVVSAAVFRLKKRLPEASIHVQVPEEFLMIPMDAILIEQVIINLFENSVMHSHSTKPIQCTVDYDTENVSFHILDYGIGIPPERLDTLFEGIPYTSGGSPDSTRGMGIGLSICKSIILAHNGAIFARNHGQGAEFIFTLPRSDEQTKERTEH